MLRSFVCALIALVFVAGGALADEIKGKFKSVDADKSTLTITVDGKDKEFKIAAGTKFVGPAGKEIKQGLKAPVFGKFKGDVVVTCEKKDAKETVTEVKLVPGKKKNDK
jgi:hypothetical protein